MDSSPLKTLTQAMHAILFLIGLADHADNMNLLSPRETVSDEEVEALYFDHRNHYFLRGAEHDLLHYPDSLPQCPHSLLAILYDPKTLPLLQDLIKRCQNLREDEAYSRREINDFRYAILRFALAVNMRRIMVSTVFHGWFANANSLKDIALGEDKTVFYRGQASEAWSLAPTFLRGMGESAQLDANAYLFHARKRGLLSKYESAIETGHGFYQRCAFFQHACSFSPLIDFTVDPVVATTFALMDPRVDPLDSPFDSLVYSFEANRDANDSDTYRVLRDKKTVNRFLEQEYRMVYLNEDYLALGKPYDILTYDAQGNPHRETFVLNTLEEVLHALTPSFTFIDLPINDRMRYQKGLFLVFHDCVCLKGHIFCELNSNFVLHRNRIAGKAKETIRNEIRRDYPHKDFAHLMNPYLFFQE